MLVENTLSKIPGYDPFRDAGDCVFDENAAIKGETFFRKCLVHIKGDKALQPFVLEDWQKAIVWNLLGWKNPDGTRRYREAFIFVPRKNGKSLLAASLCLYFLFCDGEPGAEIYAAAAEREQAKLVWDVAKQQVLNNPFLDSSCKTLQHSIFLPKLASSFKAISADANTKHGYNSHFICIDELHAQKTPDLVEVLMTSTGSRRQPMIVHITTSDFERKSICNDKHDYASKVRDGIIVDPSFLPVIYEASKDDDWESEEVWKKANPNYGISISKEYMKRECQRAKEEPAYQNTFKRLHLNIRTEQETRWLEMSEWDKCQDLEFNEKSLEGQICYGGLDLSSTEDITALVLIFPKMGNLVKSYFWIPSREAIIRQKKHRVPYLTWSKQGHIELTEGNAIDYDYIRRRVNEVSRLYDLQELAYDPWNARQTCMKLKKEDGINTIEMRQGYITMNEPCKELQRMIKDNALNHLGNPVLRWMASNATVKVDVSGNIRIVKPDGAGKVDGIVSLAMAIGLAMLKVGTGKSVYSERGIFQL